MVPVPCSRRSSDDRLTLRPLVETDPDALTAIVVRPGIREWWGSSAHAESFREGGGARLAPLDALELEPVGHV